MRCVEDSSCRSQQGRGQSRAKHKERETRLASWIHLLGPTPPRYHSREVATASFWSRYGPFGPIVQNRLCRTWPARILRSSTRGDPDDCRSRIISREANSGEVAVRPEAFPSRHRTSRWRDPGAFRKWEALPGTANHPSGIAEPEQDEARGETLPGLRTQFRGADTN
jgi:hypothetical protein